MKKTFVLFALCLCASVAKLSAQTNQVSNLLGDIGTPTISAGLQQIYDAALGSTNFAVLTGGGRSLKGKNNLAFVDYIYNFNQNAGLVLGYDYTWTGSAKKFEPGNLNFVKGGFTVNADIKRGEKRLAVSIQFESVALASPRLVFGGICLLRIEWTQ